MAAVAVPLSIERAKRPTLDIVPSPWAPAGPVAWTFAAVRVRNRPLGGISRGFLQREPAQGCAVDLDFYRWGTDERLFATLPGRWSSHREPFQAIPTGGPAPPAPVTHGTASMALSATAGAGQGPSFRLVYDPALVMLEHDVRSGPGGEEVAVAILLPAGAYAFTSESYAHQNWANPAWRLDHGTYRVEVTVRGASVECRRSFRLEYLDDDFSKFRLHPA